MKKGLYMLLEQYGGLEPGTLLELKGDDGDTGSFAIGYFTDGNKKLAMFMRRAEFIGTIK